MFPRFASWIVGVYFVFGITGGDKFIKYTRYTKYSPESHSLAGEVVCHSSFTAANAGHCCTRIQSLSCRMEHTGVRRTFKAL